MKKVIGIISFYISILVIFSLIFTLLFILSSHYWAYIITSLVLITMVLHFHRPFSFGWKYWIIWMMLMLTILLVINLGRVRQDVSFRGNLAAGVLKVLTRDLANDQANNQPKHETYNWKDWNPPHGYHNCLVQLNNTKGYLLKKKKAEPKHHQIIYQIHGGGYVNGYSNTYNKAAINYSKYSGNLPVFSIDYRIAPKYKYPTALNDVEKGYRWLLKQGYSPKDIIIAGDSAGGGLSLALTLKLKNEHQPTPKMLILSSPWTDLAASGKSYYKNYHKDVIFGSNKKPSKETTNIDIPYARKSQLKDQYVSPAYGNYNDMPPMLVQTGQDEMLLSDSTTIIDKSKDNNGDAKLITYPGMFHTFYILTPWVPESHQAWNEIHKFIKSHNK